MISIPNLPFEINEQVNHYLSHGDRYQLIQVSRVWHQVFIVLLYRTITIESSQQYKQLIHIFEENNNTTVFLLGRCVHQLNLLLDQLEEEDLRKLQKLCPFVQSIHVDWRIWNYLVFRSSENHLSSIIPLQPRNYLPRPFLPPFATKFLSIYGGCKLSTLTLDLYNIENVDGRDLLCYTPNLRNLTLMGINQHTTISIQFIEAVHQSCPYLENISLEGYKAEAYHDYIHHAIQPSNRIKCFKLQCQYGADRYQHWLPYMGVKYPHLQSLEFNHSGDGKDIIQQCPTQVYAQFIQDCPRLSHIKWNNSAPDFRFFQQLDKVHNQNLKRLEVYDSICIPSLLTLAMFDSCHSILTNVTQLTFGPVPRGMSPHSLITSIAKACPQLLHLHLCEPHCNLTIPFKIDSILDHCRKLVSLKLKRIALRVSFGRGEIKDIHPLKSLVMRHCSSFDGVLDHISPRCPNLDHLSLFAYTQRDRRYKVQIHLPHQNFRKVELHGLRTESYDVERRIRFFCIEQQQRNTIWYFMKQFEVRNQSIGRECVYRCMEMAKGLQVLTGSEIRLLHSLLEKPIPWSDVENRKREFLVNNPSTLVQDWDPKDIYDAGYVDLVCNSIDNLYINKKKVPL